jgi:1-acyl-sn-glycerol-3-phosphate acyltransferase
MKMRPAGQLPRTGSKSGIFWAAVSPEFVEKVDRYNGRVGTRINRFFACLLLLCLIGPIAYVFSHLVFSIRVRGGSRLRRLDGGAIFAMRHFYEWDPFITTFSIFYGRALLRPSTTPINLVGQFWTRTAARRAASWCLGMMGLVRGQAPNEGAIGRAARLLQSRRRTSVLIYPTGPIGTRTAYDVRPGVGYLAHACPDVPVVPVGIAGIAGIRWGDVLRLRRPRIEIRLGAPIYGREFVHASEEAAIGAVTDRIDAVWRRQEPILARAVAAARPLPPLRIGVAP